MREWRSATRRRAEGRTATRRPCGRRERDRRVAREVEELGQPQHDVSDRLLLRADAHGRRADGRSRYRQGRQDQRVVSRQRDIDFPPKHFTAGQRTHVILGEDVTRHLQPQPHRRRVALGHRLERHRVIGRRVGQHDVQIDRRDVSPACGMSTSSIRAPAARSASSDFSNAPAPHRRADRRSTGAAPRGAGGRPAAPASGRTPRPSKRMVHVPRVRHRPRERTDVIERAGQRHHAIDGDLTVARLQADRCRRRRPECESSRRCRCRCVASAMPAATLTADPPLDPPGDRDGSCGLRAGPKAESSFVVPNANSCRLVLPMMTAPAWRRRAIDRRVTRRDVALTHARCRCRRRPARRRTDP